MAQTDGDPAHSARETQKRIEEYAIECSILKVYGSEMLTLVTDELVATMGGYGYVEEYPAERFYRDARINRIFEGTNEINRLIITGWMMKRAMSGKLPLMAAIKRVMDEVMEPPSFDAGAETDEPLAREAAVLGRGQKDGSVCRRRGQPALHDRAPGPAGSHGRPGRHHQPDLCAGVGAAARAESSATAGKSSAEVAAAMTGLLADETMASGRTGHPPSARRLRRRRHAAYATGDSAPPRAFHSR